MRSDQAIHFSKIKDLTFKITMGYDDHRFKAFQFHLSQEKMIRKKRR